MPILAEAALFDLDATLPVIVIEFLILMVVLQALFFRPVTQVIDSRNDYVRSNLAMARERLAEVQALEKQYTQEMTQARVQSQTVIQAAETEANALRNQKILAAQQEAQTKVSAAREAVEAEKAASLDQLLSEADALSQQILHKLLA